MGVGSNTVSRAERGENLFTREHMKSWIKAVGAPPEEAMAQFRAASEERLQSPVAGRIESNPYEDMNEAQLWKAADVALKMKDTEMIGPIMVEIAKLRDRKAAKRKDQ